MAREGCSTAWSAFTSAGRSCFCLLLYCTDGRTIYRYEVQSLALSLLYLKYDDRVKPLKSIYSLVDDLNFMERHYKIDMSFIAGGITCMRRSSTKSKSM